MKFRFISIFCLLFILLFNSSFLYAQNEVDLIPYPSSLQKQTGQFQWYKNTVLKNESGDDVSAAITELKSISSRSAVTTGKPGAITIQKSDNQLMDGAYELQVQPLSIVIKSNSAEGFFNAVTTLKQLIGLPFFQDQQLTALTVPCVLINDEPKFKWRGIHLDVARHFFDLAYLHKVIDWMALYKFNKLHLHLTDDEGWRIEIKKYPQLTEKGAWRTYDRHDSVCIALAKDDPDYILPEKHFKVIDGIKKYGGFYTQEEMKELVGYARKHAIEIIPEIDMPGHMMAAAKLMPWLSSSGKPGFGKVFSEPLCPCKETTYEFAKNIFTEIAALFPSQYIHLGADEVDKTSWEKSKECDSVMKKEELKTYDELQSYFVHRMEKFFQSKGKKLIGWDEMLDGGVSQSAVVMYWRTWMPKVPKHAAEKGNEIIMTPGEYCYFDAKQDDNSLKKVYLFDPYGFNLSESDKKYVIGVQANTWTEYIPTENRLEYMVFPRMLAMAENAWSTKPKNWDLFEKRVIAQLPILDALKINYRFPGLQGFSAQSVFVDKALLAIKNPVTAFTVRYTTDGSSPTVNSSVLPSVMEINKPVLLKVTAFNSKGRHGDIYSINYKQTTYQSSISDSLSLKKGLNFTYYPVFYKSVNEIKESDKAQETITNAVEIPVKSLVGSFGTVHSGYFYAPETGIYTFKLIADDGSVLKIDNSILIDNDGLHTAIEKTAQVALQKGYHPFELLFIEGGGGFTLKLQYIAPSGVLKDVSQDDFFRK